MYEIDLLFAQAKSIIVLDGLLDWNPFVRHLAKAPFLVAADGAADSLGAIGISPQYVVGDGDSCIMDRCKERYQLIEEQTTTDFQKSLQFTYNQGKRPTLVLGVNGGEFDHILGNFYIVMQEKEPRTVTFLDAQQHKNRTIIKVGVPLANEIFYGKSPVGTNVSLLPFPEMVCYSTGLTWPLTGNRLSLEQNLSLRNKTSSKNWSVNVEGKGLVVYDLPFEIRSIESSS
ncbi:MAG: thiamine diphosphokinase [Chlamydiota bacterium]